LSESTEEEEERGVANNQLSNSAYMRLLQQRKMQRVEVHGGRQGCLPPNDKMEIVIALRHDSENKGNSTQGIFLIPF
jgi:hypothetical protein